MDRDEAEELRDYFAYVLTEEFDVPVSICDEGTAPLRET
jgi:hypothetical protein